MVERLILTGSLIRRNRLVPFLGVVKHRINVEDDPAKREKAVAYNLTDCKFCFAAAGLDYVVLHLFK